MFAFLFREFRSETFKQNVPVPFPIICILKYVKTLMTRSFVCSCGVYYFLSFWISCRVIQLVVCCGAIFEFYLSSYLYSLHLVKKNHLPQLVLLDIEIACSESISMINTVALVVVVNS